MEQNRLPRFACYKHWPNILLIAIIAIVSVAVMLLMLQYIIRDQSSVEVSSSCGKIGALGFCVQNTSS